MGITSLRWAADTALSWGHFQISLNAWGSLSIFNPPLFKTHIDERQRLRASRSAFALPVSQASGAFIRFFPFICWKPVRFSPPPPQSPQGRPAAPPSRQRPAARSCPRRTSAATGGSGGGRRRRLPPAAAAAPSWHGQREAVLLDK